MSGVLVNIGSNSTSPNGRGRIFEDNTFEYLPIPEAGEIRQKVPTYRQLGFAHVNFPDLPVHLDPSFETLTYGHVRRGFGDVKTILELAQNDVLFFFATLQRTEGWSPFIIGYFKDPEVYDCRGLSVNDILSLKFKGFADNAHLKRLNPSVDLLIKGGGNSRLLEKAFPLADENDHLKLRKPLGEIIYTSTGRKIKSGAPWFRWVLSCRNPTQLLDRIEFANAM